MTPYFFGTFPNFLPPPKKNHVPLSDQSYMSKTGIGLLLQPRNHDFDPPSRYSKASRRLPARNSTILSVRFDSFAALFVNESLHFVKSCATQKSLKDLIVGTNVDKYCEYKVPKRVELPSAFFASIDHPLQRLAGSMWSVCKQAGHVWCRFLPALVFNNTSVIKNGGIAL